MSLQGPILAAIDLTDTADDVLTQASAFAHSVNARLVVCHILHEAMQTRMLFPQMSEKDAEQQDALERRVREAVETRVASVTGRSPTDFEVVLDFGSAHAGILAQIDRVHAGLVVVGAGHTAERVARYAACAVLVARPSGGGCVLVATDLSDPSLPAIGIGAAEAARRGVTLRVLNCLEFGESVSLGSAFFGVLPALPVHVIDEIERDALRRMRAALARLGVEGDCMVARGAPALRIAEAAQQTAAQLLVIGTRGRSRSLRVLFGSVAETVLRTAPCSVLVVHLAT